MIMTTPAATFTVAFFIEHIIVDLGISRTLISSLYMIATIAGSLGQPLIGRMIDRYGPRRIFLIVGVLLGLSCIVLGNVFNIIILTIGFTGLRLFGQGGLWLVSENAINRWWVRRRGMALGISGMFVSVFSLGIATRITNFLIQRYEWQNAYRITGIFIICMILPLGLFLLRNRPEDFGLQPDGFKIDDKKPVIKPILEENWTRAEALHVPVFWVLAISNAMASMMYAGLFFHLISILNENGLGSSAAVDIYLPISIITAIITFTCGMFIDRLPVKPMLALAMGIQGLSLGVLPFVTTPDMLNLFGILVGITDGLFIPIGGIIWATYFGRDHLGSITGITTTLTISGSSFGPLLFGMLRDFTGSYQLITLFSAGFSILLAVIVIFTKKPAKNTLKQSQLSS